MNFENLMGNENIKSELNGLEKNHRFPHALILNGGTQDIREALSRLLSKWAVCREESKPCSECIPCQKAEKGVHPDVYFAKGSGKTDAVSVEEIRNIIADMFNEQKTFEIIDQHRQEQEQKELADKEQKTLDEIGTNTYIKNHK